MKVLITGGTGTLGQAVAKQLEGEVIIFSQSEQPQVEMKRRYPDYKYIVGNIRDYKAVKEASKGVDTIYHLAAIKHITICERQPDEALKTNVEGTMNVIKAAQKNNCKLIFISTDKAEDPSCFYGMTKLMGEHLIQTSGLDCFVMRSGNIFGSSGSVVPLFIKQIKESNTIQLTDGNMTRFFALAEDIAAALIHCGGLLYMSIKMMDLAECIRIIYGDESTKIIETGIRPGEKMNEILNGVSSDYYLSEREHIFKMLTEWEKSR
jgi:UDP-N-acetylglucosamine 4,6-dehydratase